METPSRHQGDAPAGPEGNAGSPAREAAYALWGLWRLWKQRSRCAYRGERTFEQHFLLRRIAGKGSMTVSELAEELGITPGAVTIATGRLEKAGLLKKERNDADQRVVSLSLTPAGNASLDELEAARLEVLARLLEPLSTNERQTLVMLIQRITHAARSDEDGVGAGECRTRPATT